MIATEICRREGFSSDEREAFVNHCMAMQRTHKKASIDPFTEAAFDELPQDDQNEFPCVGNTLKRLRTGRKVLAAKKKQAAMAKVRHRAISFGGGRGSAT